MATHTSRYNLSKPENTDEMASFMSDYADNMDKIDENLGGGGGSANIVELTQAEYDALPDSKLSDDTMYLIKDLNSASDAEFTHVYGLYLDPNNVINSSFIFDSTEHSWTATADCILTGNMVPHDGSTAYYVRLDGVQVFAGYSAVEDPFVYVKKGQVVKYRGKSGSSMKAYGVVAGSEVTFLSEYASACYSTQEREVGCWVDGKPLYQKSYVIPRTTISENQWFSMPSIDVTGYETIVKTEFHLGQGEKANNNYGFGRVNNGTFQVYIPYVALVVNIITLQYTKTTDVAGSGQWTPMAQPAHHYSTEEQVIGTWINGKPLYQKTVTFTAQSGGYQNVALGVSNADMMYISEAYIISNIETAVLSSYTGNVANEEFQGLIAGLTTFDYRCGSDLNGGAGMVTVRYTKSTD